MEHVQKSLMNRVLVMVAAALLLGVSVLAGMQIKQFMESRSYPERYFAYSDEVCELSIPEKDYATNGKSTFITTKGFDCKILKERCNKELPCHFEYTDDEGITSYAIEVKT